MVRTIYSYRCAKEVFSNLIFIRARGWAVFRKIFKQIDSETVIELFRKNQLRWNVFKKVLKLCDNLSFNEKLNLGDIRLLCLTNIKCFLEEERLNNEFRGKMMQFRLDQARSTAQSSRAP